MKFKLDENLPLEIRDYLNELGHEAHGVKEENLQGEPDSVILATILLEGRILLTMDIGIGDVRSTTPEQYAGIVIFRTKATGRGSVIGFVQQRLPDILKMSLNGRLFIVTEKGIRVRETQK